MIPNSAYRDPETFHEELGTLFNRGWQFVAMTSELANDRDFVCVDYPGTSLVVQNFKGELRAFQNVCTHRFGKIQTEERGNRPLTCRYHGWSYNADGEPAGLPRRREYQLQERGADLCLPRYRVEACGKLVFVSQQHDGVSLRDYLGSFYQAIEEISPHIGAELHFGTVPHKANWKVLVENVLDNLHCNLLHKETFFAWGYCRLPLEDTIIDGPHSSFHVPRMEMEREGSRRRALSHLAGRGFAHDSFYHVLIFPNLLIASTEGYSFYVGHVIPTAPNETMLRTRYFEPAVELSAGKRARQDLVNETTRDQALKIIEEDRPILENVQRGIEISEKPGIVAESEVRVRAFFEAYSNLMSGQAAAGSPVVAEPPAPDEERRALR